MAVDVKRIEARLRERICPTCVRYTADHECSLPADQDCFLFQNLEKLVEVVRTVHSTSIGPYVDQLRVRVCALCNEDVKGSCPFRSDLDCALDTYLPIIVDEIEKELNLQRHERGRATA